jgi:hypothetical protein
MKWSLTPILFSVALLSSSLLEAEDKSVPELDQLEKKFNAQVKEVGQSIQKETDQLSQSYLTALNRELSSVEQSGKLENVLPFRTEKERIEKGEALPGRDDPMIPVVLKKLRAAYRASLTKIGTEKDKRLEPLTEAYGKSLASLVSALTRSGRIDEATVVEQKRLAIQDIQEMKRFEGVWDISYSIGTSRRYRINAIGNVVWMTSNTVSSTARLTKKGDDYMLDFNDGKLERFSLRGGKLLVEHFDPSSRYLKGGPNTTGSGEKLKSR